VTTIPNGSHLGPVFRDEHAPLRDAQAVLEAQACLQCGGPCAAAPCAIACPAGINIPSFIHDIAHDRPLKAAATIFADNVLGGTCARVCPVEVLCEGSCVLLKEGRRAIHIGRLQRYATDQAFESGQTFLKTSNAALKQQSIGVIGAGPAGLACAAELATLGYPVIVYERREFPGGLVTRGIAPYKQQYKPLPEEVEQIANLGVAFRFGVCIGKDLTVEQLRARHQAIFLGVGLGDDMPARVPGEDLPGVWESLRFIETLKLSAARGLTLGRRVAVIGGGNTAIDVAREAVLLRASELSSNTAIDVAREALMLGATEVMMLYRRSETEMPAFAHEIAAARREGVKIVPLVAPVEFVGSDKVTGVRCVRMKLGAPDSSGRPRPEPILGSEFVIEADTVIKAIGQKPHADVFKLFGVEMNGNAARVDRTMRTTAKGIYAGGDAINGGATVVQAVRDGRDAARTIDRDLFPASAPLPLAKPSAHVEQSVDGTIRHFQADFRLTTAPRLCKGCNICVTTCPTHTLKLDGVNQIAVKDPATCVFCGLCEARCPDFAIWIVKGQSDRARTNIPEGELAS
jgi:dihydropyrimidine dehydrogenase (NAD+) subunit PreT